MKSVTFALIVGLSSATQTTGVVLAAAPAGNNTQAIVMVSLQLKDGGRITGQPLTSALPFYTDYAKTEIAWSSLTKCELAASNAPSVLYLKNGDQLRGQVGLDKLNLETPLGKMAIPIEEVLLLSVRQGGSGCGLEGLVLYYPFDEDAGDVVHDASGNGNDGRVYGAKWTSKDHRQGVYEFAGQDETGGQDDYLETVSSDLFRARNQLSACAWVYMRKDWCIFLSNYHGGMPYRGHFEFVASRDGCIHVRFGQASGVMVSYHSREPSLIHPDEWHHVAFSYDESRGINNKVKIFIDGQDVESYVVESEGNGGTILDTQENLRIMGDRSRLKSDGYIDEVMIFNRALSADEVVGICQRESALLVNSGDAKTVEARAKQPIKAQMELADGSHLVGELQPDELGIRTASLGKVSVPFRLLRSIQFSEGGKRVAASLTNGDKVIGEPLFSKLTVMAAFGRVNLTATQLQTLTFLGTKSTKPATQ